MHQCSKAEATLDSDPANLDRICDRALSDLTWRMLPSYDWQTALMMLMIVAIL